MTTFDCIYCGEVAPILEPLSNGTVAAFCSQCGSTEENPPADPQVRLEAAERAYEQAVDDLRTGALPHPPGFFAQLTGDDLVQAETSLRLSRFDNARFEFNAARMALGLERI